MRGKILTVEDDAAIRMLIVSVLEADGHELFEAADGLQALPVARECRPDVVLLDIGLPGQDGFAVLDELKADAELREVPVLMVTAWADPELVGRALDRGAAGYIRKPFDIEDLGSQVGQALSGDIRGQAARQRLADEIDTLVADEQDFAVVVATVDADAEDALVAAGHRFGERLRGDTVGGRWSDDTFVFVAPGAGLHAAGELAEELLHSLAERPLSTVRAGRLTASFGVAEAKRGEPGTDLLGRASEALRTAGTNAVRLAV